jgi:putative PIN family toxin of toxin-antitoxin system
MDLVLDTNVLLSALRSNQGASFRLLAQLPEKRYRLHVSTPLVAEYEAVLKRGQLALTGQQIENVIDYLCSQAVAHEIFYLWRPVLKDPDDDFLLELAVKAGAHIVTWNLADFKKASGLGVQVLTPRDVLQRLEV